MDFFVETKMKTNNSGRSMVEMLGVLAVISVLSVGILAGYSKAMMQYKLNKHLEQINELVDMVLTNEELLHGSLTHATYAYITSLIVKLSGIPDGMTYLEDRGIYLQDIFKNYIGLAEVNGDNVHYVYMFAYFNKEFPQSCVNLFKIAKERSLWVSSVLINGSSVYYGDKECQNNQRCLADITISTMNDLCKNCVITQNNSCVFEINWNI